MWAQARFQRKDSGAILPWDVKNKNADKRLEKFLLNRTISRKYVFCYLSTYKSNFGISIIYTHMLRYMLSYFYDENA